MLPLGTPPTGMVCLGLGALHRLARPANLPGWPVSPDASSVWSASTPHPDVWSCSPTSSCVYLFASQRPQPVNTDRWYCRAFQSTRDDLDALLNRLTLPVRPESELAASS